jgi:hypothetical protein
MEILVATLGLALVVSAALQQLIDLIEPAMRQFVPEHKGWLTALLALLLSMGLTLGLGLRLLAPLGLGGHGWLDVVLTALFLLGGTRGINDLLKWIGYRKAAARQALSGPPPMG